MIWLERIFQRELDVPLRRVSACDLAEVGIRDATVRLAVVGNVEKVKEVTPEVQALLAPHGKSFSTDISICS